LSKLPLIVPLTEALTCESSIPVGMSMTLFGPSSKVTLKLGGSPAAGTATASEATATSGKQPKNFARPIRRPFPESAGNILEQDEARFGQFCCMDGEQINKDWSAGVRPSGEIKVPSP
jgi:hypothetical protein